MPKQTTSKKVVTSKGGRKISTPVGLLFIAVGALFLTIAGTFAYTQYKERDLQAKAAKWKTITPNSIQRDGGDGVKFVGCREYQDIGPDAQQGKLVKVTILASKPKDLSNKGKPASAGFGVLNAKRNQGVGISSNIWWNNELASVSLGNIQVGDKLYVTAESDKSVARPSDTDFDSYESQSNPQLKRIYHTIFIKKPSDYKTEKEYKNALKAFNQKLISVAQLPNCN